MFDQLCTNNFVKIHKEILIYIIIKKKSFRDENLMKVIYSTTP